MGDLSLSSQETRDLLADFIENAIISVYESDLRELQRIAMKTRSIEGDTNDSYVMRQMVDSLKSRVDDSCQEYMTINQDEIRKHL